MGDIALYDERDRTIADLKAENTTLRRDLASARAEASRLGRESETALGGLRRQLSPLYRALQAVFGELDAAGVAGEDARTPVDSRTTAVWASWKERLGGGAAKVIDALLLHNDLSTSQLAIATGLHRTTIPKLIYTLNKAGLLNKNSGRFSLKSL